MPRLGKIVRGGVLTAVLLLALPAAGQDCPLDSITVVTPRDGTTLYVDESGSLQVQFEAEPGCVSETDRVEFFLAQPGSAVFSSIGSDATYPYRASYNFLATTFDAPWTLRAVAIPTDSEADAVQTETNFTFVAVGDSTDGDANGLPDTPFATLAGTTDVWRATGQFTDAAYALLGAASSIYGYTTAQEPYPASVSISLASPDNAGQVLTVKASQSLLEEGEYGILIVGMAPDAISLMGDTQANRPNTAAPSSTMDPDAQYVHVSLLISDDDGATYSEVPGTRLAANPIEITLAGLPLTGGQDYTLGRYPTAISTSGGAISITSSTGSWASVANQEVDYETGTITADLVRTGLHAAFAASEITSGTSLGDTDFWMVVSPILLALGIIQLADGDGPCFIATAAYGTPLAGEIDALRYVRDNALLTSAPGSMFVDAYYRISPALADRVAASPMLALLVRACLTPVVWFIRLCVALPGTVLLCGGLTALVPVLVRIFRRTYCKRV